MLGSASDVIEISSSDEDEHKGVCERNPLCTRGFKHGGFGGHCSLKAIKGINGSSGSRASTISEAWQKHGTVVIASSDKLPLGWTVEERSTENCVYKVYRGPDGRRAKSMKKAWEMHEGGGVSNASSSKANASPPVKKPSVKEAAPPPPSEAPVAPKRERITRLP